jgi:hypothetical protein
MEFLSRLVRSDHGSARHQIPGCKSGSALRFGVTASILHPDTHGTCTSNT